MRFCALLAALAAAMVSAQAADPKIDPFEGMTVLTKRDAIPLMAKDKTGKLVRLGDTGGMALILTVRSEGDKVLVRYRAQDVWLAKDDFVLASDAEKHFGAAIAKNPKDASAYIRRGMARRMVEKLDAALADMEQAVKLAPKSAAALNYRGAVHSARKDAAKAAADFQAAIDLDPEWWVPRNNLGGALRAAKTPDEVLRRTPKF